MVVGTKGWGRAAQPGYRPGEPLGEEAKGWQSVGNGLVGRAARGATCLDRWVVFVRAP